MIQLLQYRLVAAATVAHGIAMTIGHDSLRNTVALSRRVTPNAKSPDANTLLSVTYSLGIKSERVMSGCWASTQFINANTLNEKAAKMQKV